MLENYCDLLIIMSFLDCSCSWVGGCISVLAFEVADTSSKLYLLTSGGRFFCWSSLCELLFPAVYGHTCFTLLAPSCGRILKFYVFSGSYNSLVGCWQPSFCFPEGDTKTQVCGFSLAHRPWPVFWRDSLFRWACFLYWGTGTRSQLQSVRKCWFSSQGLEGAHGPGWVRLQWGFSSVSQVSFLLESW